MKLPAHVMLATLLLIATAATAAEKPKSSPQFIRPFPVVMIPTGASTVHKDLAKKLAESIGIHVISEMPRNPVCCIWIDINLAVPNPGEPGYFILNQGGGSIVSASNEQQLLAAVDRFIGSIRQDSDAIEVPAGMMTSYPVVPAPAK